MNFSQIHLLLLLLLLLYICPTHEPLARKCMVKNISPLALKCDESFHVSLQRSNCVMTHDSWPNTVGKRKRSNTVSHAQIKKKKKVSKKKAWFVKIDQSFHTQKVSACSDEESFEWYHRAFITHDPKLVGSTEDHLFGLYNSWSVTQFPSLNSLIFELWVMETQNTF